MAAKVAQFVSMMSLASSWRIRAPEFLSAAEFAAASQTEALLGLLPQAKQLSSAPMSKFNVGAVVLGGSGNVYLGANIEYPNTPAGFSVHAEQCAIVNAFLAQEKSIKAIAVTAMPCGHCRQFLNDLPDASNIAIIVDNHSGEFTLGDLLPHSFGAEDLSEDVPSLLEHRGSALRVANTSLVRGEGATATDQAMVYATVAAQQSYAPHTKGHAGIALVYGDRHITGSYIENSAFNPSLEPLQVALINARIHGLGDSRPDGVVLAERRHGLTPAHLDPTLTLLRALGIDVPVTYLQLEEDVTTAQATVATAAEAKAAEFVADVSSQPQGGEEERQQQMEAEGTDQGGRESEANERTYKA